MVSYSHGKRKQAGQRTTRTEVTLLVLYEVAVRRTGGKWWVMCKVLFVRWVDFRVNLHPVNKNTENNYLKLENMIVNSKSLKLHFAVRQSVTD